MKKILLVFLLLLSLLWQLNCSYASGIITVGGGGASLTYHYVTTTNDSALTNSFNLGGLSTGILKQTVSGGVSTPASVSNTSFVTYSAGTAATITSSAGALTFGTTSPSITITQAGNYLIISGGTILANGATFAAAQTVQLYIQRTNNTPGQIGNTPTTIEIPIMTTLTTSIGSFITQQVVYTTANTTDALAIYGVLSTNPSAGSVQATSAWIMAIALY